MDIQTIKPLSRAVFRFITKILDDRGVHDNSYYYYGREYRFVIKNDNVYIYRSTGEGLELIMKAGAI